MTDLAAIVRATRASANALKRHAKAQFDAKHATTEREQQAAIRRSYKAMDAYHAAQRVLSTNPLPGDETLSNDA